MSLCVSPTYLQESDSPLPNSSTRVFYLFIFFLMLETNHQYILYFNKLYWLSDQSLQPQFNVSLLNFDHLPF